MITMLRKVSPSTAGFTLIELLVVVAIIGVLATTVLSSLQDSRAAARDARRFQEVRQLQTALELYRNNNNGLYPCHNVSNCSDATAVRVDINSATTDTAFFDAINYSPTFESPSVLAGVSILYRLRGPTATPDRTSYTILVRTERGRVNGAGTQIPAGVTGWCRIDQGLGNGNWSGYPTCF